MQRIMRYPAIRRRTKSRRIHQLQLQPVHIHHLPRPGHQQRAEMRQILRPVRDDHRLRITRQIIGQMMRSLDPAQLHVDPRRHMAQIGDDVALHPAMRLLRQRQRHVKFIVAKFRHQRDADQRACKSVEFGVEEIAHEKRTACWKGVKGLSAR